MRYLASTGQFADWCEMQIDWEEPMGKDSNDVWSAFKSDSEVMELIFSIVVNQTGCERTFSSSRHQIGLSAVGIVALGGTLDLITFS